VIHNTNLHEDLSMYSPGLRRPVVSTIEFYSAFTQQSRAGKSAKAIRATLRAMVAALLVGSALVLGMALLHQVTADQAGKTMGQRAGEIGGGTRTEILHRQFEEGRKQLGIQ
jgi:hypothetical protein